MPFDVSLILCVIKSYKGIQNSIYQTKKERKKLFNFLGKMFNIHFIHEEKFRKLE